MTSIYIDTNVFLGFYQSAKDRMGIFQDLRERADSLLFPEQTIMEFRRNRASCLTALAARLEKSATTNVFTTAIVHELPEFKKWENARDAAKIHMRAIINQLRTWAKDELSDPVYEEFRKLYCDGMTISTPTDALLKAQQRKLLGEPPTSPDKHTVGDEIIWETLLDSCTKDLIIVSRDATFLNNESILRTEFNDSTRKLLMVTGSLSAALNRVGKPSSTIEHAEEELDDEADERRAFKTGICSFCHVKMVTEGYEGGEGDESWWLACPNCGFLAFPDG